MSNCKSCGAPITWQKVQGQDGTLKNVPFNAGTNIIHFQTCPARQQKPQGQQYGQPQQYAAPQQYGQPQPAFQPQQQTINPFAPTTVAHVEQPVQAPQQPMPEPQSGPTVQELLVVLNQTMTNGMLAILKELRPDNEDSLLATIVNNTSVLIDISRPNGMIDAQVDQNIADETQATKPAEPENPFEAPKEKKGKK